MIPPAGRPTDNSRLNAPRGLKLPVCCVSSSLRATGECSPISTRNTGVCRTYADMRDAAAAIDFRLLMISERCHVGESPTSCFLFTHDAIRMFLCTANGECTEAA